MQDVCAAQTAKGQPICLSFPLSLKLIIQPLKLTAMQEANVQQQTQPNTSQPKARKISKPLQLALLIAGGIILILVSVLLKQFYPSWTVVFELLNSIGQAMIIGPALSWVLDLQSTFNYFKKVTVASLLSKDYLLSMDPDELAKLRQDCTSAIHRKAAEDVEEGLMEIDEQVCGLLDKPYFERYRQHIMCSVSGDSFIKRHNVEEKLTNPRNQRITYDNLPKTYLFVPPDADEKDYYKVIKFTVRIDSEPEKDWTNDVDVVFNAVTENDVLHHNKQAIIVNKRTGVPLTFEYTKTIILTRVYEVKTSKADITFIKRVTMPVKSFTLDYSYAGSDLRLIGSCFGTLSSGKSGAFRIIQENNVINIESFDWLLPGNGIFVVKVPK